MAVPWQDREIRLDVNREALKLRPGETLFEKYDNVEDTKANNGERGTLIITCLRVMWVSNSQSRVNICEYASFVNILSKAYDISRPYREMRLRAAIVDDGVLRLLPGEVVYHNVDGVFNLTSESGSLGAIIITNIRLVWYSVLNELFNVSLPYLQIGTIALRESKFGIAIIVETRATSSSDVVTTAGNTSSDKGEHSSSSSSSHTPYVLGFRIDPAEKLQRIVKELKSCHEVYAKTPLFGVEYCMPTNVTAITEAATRAAAAAASDEQLMFDVLRQGTSSRLEAKADKSVTAAASGREETSSGRTSRYAQRDNDAVNNEQEGEEDDDPDSLKSRPVIYSEELGLAIQKPPAGVTLHDLWVVPT